MHRPPRESNGETFNLDNETCPYCGLVLTASTRTKEHVIGRNFVPKGLLNRSWNVILWACQKCNHAKSLLENDLSAITMQPDVEGNFALNHAALRAEAERKARRSISHRTRKPVGLSSETFSITQQLRPGVSVSTTFVAPPQLDEKRVCALAHYQITGLFYLISYESVTPRRGGYWPGRFVPLMMSYRTDWGNAVQRAFMASVKDWVPRVLGNTPEGFFRAAIRRNPDQKLWSWALEWNGSVRVIGFFGDADVAHKIMRAFPKLTAEITGRVDHGHFAGRFEVPIDEPDDEMFRDFDVDWNWQPC
jgi:hypothetical protein